MTAPAVDTSEITLEDIAPPCHWQACHLTAEWVTVWTCSCMYFYCDGHKEYMVASTKVKCDSRRHGTIPVTASSVERI